MNHGVELHNSVVEYAKDRLDDFVGNCPSLDMMDFTRPIFVEGNALLLDPSTSFGSYDRVYCGAAVPDEHQTFIRSLIKINGIAVMPCGEQVI